MFLQSKVLPEQFSTMFWAYILIPSELLGVENEHRTLHVSVP